MALAKAGTEDRQFAVGQGDISSPASFPFLVDMQEWWSEWGPKILNEYGKTGWILLILDSYEKLEGLLMTMARLLRKKPEWNTDGWSAQEWENIEDRATEAYAWFCRNIPDQRDIPEFAKFLLVAEDGLFCAFKKMAAEVREIQEEGHLLVNLTKPEDGTIESADKVYLEN